MPRSGTAEATEVPGRGVCPWAPWGAVPGGAGLGSRAPGSPLAGMLPSTSPSSSEVCEMSEPRPYWLSQCLLLLPLRGEGARGSLPRSQNPTSWPSAEGHLSISNCHPIAASGHHCHVWVEHHFRHPGDVGITCLSEVWSPIGHIWALVFYKNNVWVVKPGACA